jgi:hypothetical protein
MQTASMQQLGLQHQPWRVAGCRSHRRAAIAGSRQAVVARAAMDPLLLRAARGEGEATVEMGSSDPASLLGKSHCHFILANRRCRAHPCLADAPGWPLHGSFPRVSTSVVALTTATCAQLQVPLLPIFVAVLPSRYSDKYPFRMRSETPDIAIELSMQPWRAFKPDGKGRSSKLFAHCSLLSSTSGYAGRDELVWPGELATGFRDRQSLAGRFSSCLFPNQSWSCTMYFPIPGVIFFSDILTPLPALGIEFDVIKGKGPVIANPVRSMDQVCASSVLRKLGSWDGTHGLVPVPGHSSQTQVKVRVQRAYSVHTPTYKHTSSRDNSEAALPEITVPGMQTNPFIGQVLQGPYAKCGVSDLRSLACNRGRVLGRAFTEILT